MDKHDRTAVVVVGGGVLGCSIAWHLACAGQSDVVVLERNDIGSGATSRSAGLVSRGRLHVETLGMVGRTHEAFRELEAELGEPVGFRRVGNLRVAASEVVSAVAARPGVVAVLRIELNLNVAAIIVGDLE